MTSHPFLNDDKYVIYIHNFKLNPKIMVQFLLAYCLIILNYCKYTRVWANAYSTSYSVYVTLSYMFSDLWC